MIKDKNTINNGKKGNSNLDKRLDVIISLLLRMVPKDKSMISLKEQVNILNDLGVRPRDISDILGRTQGHINKELTELRKGKKHGEKK